MANTFALWRKDLVFNSMHFSKSPAQRHRIALASLARPSLLILGTRGIPAVHGGFETFAEKFALHLAERGWHVTVYCQAEELGVRQSPTEDNWHGIRRVHVTTRSRGALATIEFDWLSTLHALREDGIPLVLGYNTAAFSLLFRAAGRPLLMNMDGIEWARTKWSKPAKLWFYLNERIGALGASKLIADHPAIANHLETRRRRDDIVTIPYGADEILSASTQPISALGVEPGNYFVSVARIEPENSILEMVSAYVATKKDAAFVCVGALDPTRNRYHAKVLNAARGEVIFPGPVYDKERIQALRFHALAYCHGHTVGGTNPSLVEALGAGNAIIAHDNPFNRWVAGSEQIYFRGTESCSFALARAAVDPEWREAARLGARRRFDATFRWPTILSDYEKVCLALDKDGSSALIHTTSSTAEGMS